MTARRAGFGYWAAQIGAAVAAAATPFLVLFSQYPNLVKVIPAGLAAVLAAFNGLTDWRGLATARGDAVTRMDREFTRFYQGRLSYQALDKESAARRFSDSIERLDEVAERSRWLGGGQASTPADEHEHATSN